MKKIEDLIHLCPKLKVLVTSAGGVEYIDEIESVVYGESVNLKDTGDYYFNGENDFQIFPIMRPLHSMDDETAKRGHWGSKKAFDDFMELHKFGEKGHVRWFTEDFNFLLGEGFDLFDWIEAGVAIDATTLKLK